MQSYIVVHIFAMRHDCLNLKREKQRNVMAEEAWKCGMIQRKTNSNYIFHDYAKNSLWIKSHRKMHGLIKKSFFQQTEREFTHGTSFHIIHRRMVRKEWNHCIRQIWIVSVERLKHWQYREFLHKRAVDSETNEKRNWEESSWFQLKSEKITKQKFPFEDGIGIAELYFLQKMFHKIFSIIKMFHPKIPNVR